MGSPAAKRLLGGLFCPVTSPIHHVSGNRGREADEVAFQGGLLTKELIHLRDQDEDSQVMLPRRGGRKEAQGAPVEGRGGAHAEDLQTRLHLLRADRGPSKHLLI